MYVLIQNTPRYLNRILALKKCDSIKEIRYFHQGIKWSFTRFKVFLLSRVFSRFLLFQTEWEQLKKAKGNQLNCRFHFSVSPLFSTRLLWGKTTRFLPKTETINNFVAKKKMKKKGENAQTSWARKRSWYENMLWLIALLEYKQF